MVPLVTKMASMVNTFDRLIESEDLLTFPGSISTTIPKACGTTRISLKMMAASKSNRLMGIRVTSQASLGFWTRSKKGYLKRMSRNSGNKKSGK